MPFCTPRTCPYACREGSRCTSSSRFSDCREGRGCTTRTCFSPCREGKVCTTRSRFSSCRGGKGCTPCSCFSPCRAGRGCTSRIFLSPSRASTASLLPSLTIGSRVTHPAVHTVSALRGRTCEREEGSRCFFGLHSGKQTRSGYYLAPKPKGPKSEKRSKKEVSILKKARAL